MERLRLPPAGCLVILLLLAGCATPAPPPAERPPLREAVSVRSFSLDPFLSVNLPQSRMHSHKEMVRILGAPLQTLTREVPNKHDPSVMDSVITLRYAFGDLAYLHVPGKDVENLLLMRLRGNQIPLKYGVRFGSTTREDIRKLFGPPQDIQENSYSYSVRSTEEITNLTTFYFRDEMLLEVEISSLMMD
jgi:hypothetical protein